MTGKEDIDWDGLDKRKFFGYGAAMFTGATTLLYPLHVIKTRQMALPDISPGFKGTWQTVTGMWTGGGVRGFYRGYATSVFGFLPARMVYLASLEVSKSTVHKLGQQLELSDTVLAGVSNFAGGASASLAVQSIGVPLDVISQRQMVYNGAPAASAAAAAAAPGATGSSTAATPLASATTGVSPAGGTSPAAGATTATTVGGTAASRPSSVASPLTPPSAAPATAAATMQPANVGSSSASASSATAAPQNPSPASGTPTNTSSSSTPLKPDGTRSLSTASASTSSTAARGAAAAGSRHLSGLQVARTILATEGVRGLYRGFGMSIATVVPSSAVWWAAYGAYQQLFWRALIEAGVGGAAAPDSAVPVLDKNTMLVQSSASVAAGLTAGLLTNPLDLIKTRIQVAGQLDGASPTFRSVVGRIISEDGYTGLWRGVLPRMLNSAIWGTAMVGIYETLKRLSKKSPHEMALAAAEQK